MKPFDLQKALAGEKVMTRDGRSVSDLHYFKDTKVAYPLYANVNGELYSYTKSGHYCDLAIDSVLNLVMVSRTQKIFVNIFDRGDGQYFAGNVYCSKELADAAHRAGTRVICLTGEIEV